jgi:AraC family transcriptional activator of pobA
MNQQAVNPITDANTANLTLRGFNVYQINATESGAPTYNRRDFYKIVLSTSHMLIHYADQSIEVNGTFLFFSNPHVPYSVELLSPTHTGYSCLFNELFLQVAGRLESVQQSPLFRIGARPVFVLNQEQKALFDPLFEKMLQEQDSDYPFKDELVRNYIQLIVHEALKIQPSDRIVRSKSAASRIAALFLDLLERQFPIEAPQRPLTLRTAQDYANRLSIHVNHLNRAVKTITGKPTTKHIAERIVGEAKALLQYTNWPIAEIAYGLGFDYPTHFNNYFKRVADQVPNAFRKQ